MAVQGWQAELQRPRAALWVPPALRPSDIHTECTRTSSVWLAPLYSRSATRCAIEQLGAQLDRNPPVLQKGQQHSHAVPPRTTAVEHRFIPGQRAALDPDPVSRTQPEQEFRFRLGSFFEPLSHPGEERLGARGRSPPP